MAGVGVRAASQRSRRGERILLLLREQADQPGASPLNVDDEASKVVVDTCGHVASGFARHDHDVPCDLGRDRAAAPSLCIRHDITNEPILARSELIAGACPDQLCAIVDEPFTRHFPLHAHHPMRVASVGPHAQRPRDHDSRPLRGVLPVTPRIRGRSPANSIIGLRHTEHNQHLNGCNDRRAAGEPRRDLAVKEVTSDRVERTSAD